METVKFSWTLCGLHFASGFFFAISCRQTILYMIPKIYEFRAANDLAPL